MYRKSLGDGVKLLAHDLVLLFLLSITLKSAFIIKELDDFKSFGNRKEIIDIEIRNWTCTDHTSKGQIDCVLQSGS